MSRTTWNNGGGGEGTLSARQKNRAENQNGDRRRYRTCLFPFFCFFCFFFRREPDGRARRICVFKKQAETKQTANETVLPPSRFGRENCESRANLCGGRVSLIHGKDTRSFNHPVGMPCKEGQPRGRSARRDRDGERDSSSLIEIRTVPFSVVPTRRASCRPTQSFTSCASRGDECEISIAPAVAASNRPIDRPDRPDFLASDPAARSLARSER